MVAAVLLLCAADVRRPVASGTACSEGRVAPQQCHPACTHLTHALARWLVPSTSRLCAHVTVSKSVSALEECSLQAVLVSEEGMSSQGALVSASHGHGGQSFLCGVQPHALCCVASCCVRQRTADLISPSHCMSTCVLCSAALPQHQLRRVNHSTTHHPIGVVCVALLLCSAVCSRADTHALCSCTIFGVCVLLLPVSCHGPTTHAAFLCCCTWSAGSFVSRCLAGSMHERVTDARVAFRDALLPGTRSLFEAQVLKG